MSTFRKVSIGLALGLALVSGTGCSGKGPVGTYELDKEAMLTNLEKHVASLPEKERPMAKFAAAMMSAMDLKVAVLEGAKMTLTTSKPKPSKDGEFKSETKDGTWKLEGKRLILSVPGSGGEMPCDLTSTGLTCSQGKTTLVFKKTS